MLRKLISDDKDLRTERTILALLGAFIIGLAVALLNGVPVGDALRGALYLAIIAGAVVAVLAWIVDMIRQKRISVVLVIFAVLLIAAAAVLLL